MLNLVNNVSVDKATHLITPVADTRRLDLYISHNNVLIVLGYENDRCVWLSQTETTDELSARRIFDSLRHDRFFSLRYARGRSCDH